MKMKAKLIESLSMEIVDVEALEEKVKKNKKYKIWERGYFTGVKLGLKTALRIIRNTMPDET